VNTRSLQNENNKLPPSFRHQEDVLAQSPTLASGFSHPSLIKELPKTNLGSVQLVVQPHKGEENLEANGNINSMGSLYAVSYHLV
jgi:hypothetical protein